MVWLAPLLSMMVTFGVTRFFRLGHFFLPAAVYTSRSPLLNPESTGKAVLGPWVQFKHLVRQAP